MGQWAVVSFLRGDTNHIHLSLLDVNHGGNILGYPLFFEKHYLYIIVIPVGPTQLLMNNMCYTKAVVIIVSLFFSFSSSFEGRPSTFTA